MACSGVGKYSASPQYQPLSDIRGTLTTPIKWFSVTLLWLLVLFLVLLFAIFRWVLLLAIA
jgi:hypothetical protein